MNDNGFESLLVAEHERQQYRLCGWAPAQLPFGTALTLNAYGFPLRGMRSVMPGLILVGGAVRDSLLGREIKDIDLMTTDRADVERLSGYLNDPLLDCLRNMPDANREGYAGEPSLIAAYETASKSHNLLLVPSIMKRIDEFPDSISQCWTDGEFVYGTPKFCATLVTNVVTYDPLRIRGERLAKLQKKYSDFTFTPT